MPDAAGAAVPPVDPHVDDDGTYPSSSLPLRSPEVLAHQRVRPDLRVPAPRATASAGTRREPERSTQPDLHLVGLGGLRPYVRVVKPLVDRVLGLAALLVLLPLLLVLAAGVLLTAGRPVLFRQVRVGKDHRPFSIYKFRTMRPDRRKAQENIAHADRRLYHKSDEDPRHMPFGRFLRRYSLDELPQLFNVVRGDMSLVGPRPELPHIVAMYEPWQHRRHLVRPGLTGPWQLSARGTGQMHDHVHLDVDYVDRLSLLTDLLLLTRTVPSLLVRKGG